VFIENYCSGCHSIKFMRYARIGDDLGLTKEVTDNLNFAGAKHRPRQRGDESGRRGDWFGKTPPGLSLVGRSARVGLGVYVT